MTAYRAKQVAIIALLAFVATVEVWAIRTRLLEFYTYGWLSLLLLIMAGAAVLLTPQREASFLLSVILISVSVLFSGILSAELASALGGWLGLGGHIAWAALFFLLPFVFVHFALSFPVRNEWMHRSRFGAVLLYLPYTLIVAWEVLDADEVSFGGLIRIVIFLLGILVGVAIFSRQYVFSLTAAEKNRLRIILAGCLIGLLPRFLTAFAGSQLPAFAEPLALVLLPLFPLALSLAVLKSNIAEVGWVIRICLVGAYVVAGLITSIFIAEVLIVPLIPARYEQASLWISATTGVLVLYPLSIWATRYVLPRFVESRLSPRFEAPEKFQPITPNPFIVGNPVRSSEMFFGRKEEFRFIRSTLESRREGAVIVITGERRTGKTSVLYQILSGRLGSAFLPVFVDMQAMVVRDDAEFLGLFAHHIASALPENLRGQASSSTGNPYEQFRRYLESLLRQIQGRQLILLVDEYELIESRVRAGRLSPEIPAFLNSLLEANPGLSLVLTGSRPVSDSLFWSPLLQKAVHRAVSFLSRRDAEELLQIPLKSRAAFTPRTLGLALRLTHGQPFFTQLIGQTLVDVLNEERQTLVRAPIMGKVMRRIVDHPPPQLLYRWQGISRDERLVLAALALLIRSPDQYVRSSKVHSVLSTIPHRYGFGHDQASVRILLETLRKREILDRDQNRYRFLMDLLRLWVAEEHTVWSVLAAESGAS